MNVVPKRKVVGTEKKKVGNGGPLLYLGAPNRPPQVSLKTEKGLRRVQLWMSPRLKRLGRDEEISLGKRLKRTTEEKLKRTASLR